MFCCPNHSKHNLLTPEHSNEHFDRRDDKKQYTSFRANELDENSNTKDGKNEGGEKDSDRIVSIWGHPCDLVNTNKIEYVEDKKATPY